MENKIEFINDNRIAVIDSNMYRTELSAEDIQYILNESELRSAINDVKIKLAERFAGGDEDNDGSYDYAKYPPDILRKIAKNVVESKDDNTSMSDVYDLIVVRTSINDLRVVIMSAAWFTICVPTLWHGTQAVHTRRELSRIILLNQAGRCVS
jgi:hypothetical protein